MNLFELQTELARHWLAFVGEATATAMATSCSIARQNIASWTQVLGLPFDVSRAQGTAMHEATRELAAAPAFPLALAFWTYPPLALNPWLHAAVEDTRRAESNHRSGTTYRTSSGHAVATVIRPPENGSSSPNSMTAAGRPPQKPRLLH